METHDIFQCMSALRPGLLWKMYEENNPIPENKLENVHWETSDVVTPTMSEIEEYHNNVFKPNLLIAKLRKKRNIKLGQSDWTQTNDIGLENEVEWEVYRQALRDLPSTTEDPETPIWPEQPQVKIVKGKNIRTELSDTKADLSETKADLSETKADLQTTRTELADLKERLNTHTHPLEEHTHPLEPHTHPLEEHTHPDLVDQLTVEKAKTYELENKVVLLNMSYASLIQRIEALEKL